MTSATARLLWLPLVAVGVLACATSPVSSPKKARVLVRVDDKPRGAPCPGRHIDVVEGPVPRDAVVITRATTETVALHVSLRAHEDAARDRAMESCADGVSVLQAEEGKSGVARTVVVFWRNRAEGEGLNVVDAGVAAVVFDAGVAAAAVVDGGEVW